MLKGACPLSTGSWSESKLHKFKKQHTWLRLKISKTNLLVLPRFFMFKIIGPSEILTKIKNILTHGSVAQAGLIDEENWR